MSGTIRVGDKILASHDNVSGKLSMSGDVDLANVDMSNVDMSNVDMSNVDMSNVDMSNVDMSSVLSIPRAYFLGTTYNNSTTPTITADSGISGTLSTYGVILVSQPIGFASTEYLLDFSIVLSGITGFSTTGSVSLNGFTSKYRLPVYYQGIAGLTNQFILEESRTDSSGALWFFEWNDLPGTDSGTTHALLGKAISTTKPDWVY